MRELIQCSRQLAYNAGIIAGRADMAQQNIRGTEGTSQAAADTISELDQYVRENFFAALEALETAAYEAGLNEGKADA